MAEDAETNFERKARPWWRRELGPDAKLSRMSTLMTVVVVLHVPLFLDAFFAWKASVDRTAALIGLPVLSAALLTCGYGMDRSSKRG